MQPVFQTKISKQGKMVGEKQGNPRWRSAKRSRTLNLLPIHKLVLGGINAGSVHAPLPYLATVHGMAATPFHRLLYDSSNDEESKKSCGSNIKTS